MSLKEVFKVPLPANLCDFGIYWTFFEELGICKVDCVNSAGICWTESMVSGTWFFGFFRMPFGDRDSEREFIEESLGGIREDSSKCFEGGWGWGFLVVFGW